MRIKDFKIFRYSLPLRKTLVIKGKRLTRREGIIIQLTNESGVSSFGEIAPLPGLSHENLSQALQQIKKLRILVLNTRLSDGVVKLNGGFEKWFKKFKLFPSVRFGMETAILNLYAKTKNISLAKLILGVQPKIIFVNGLLDGTKKEVLSQAKSMVKAGWKSLKIKIGKEPLIDEMEKVKALQKIVGEHTTLRLDINCQFNQTTATVFGLVIGKGSIDYIEEPLEDISKLSVFTSETALPVALDENMNQFAKLIYIKNIKAWVIKPTIIGSIEKSVQLIRLAKKHNIHPVISSSFETGIGLTALANLAACNPHIACGLDTQKYFKYDISKYNFSPKNGKINLIQLNKSKNQIRFNLLKKVYV